MKIPGIRMNLRLVLALVVGGAVFATADSTSVANSQVKKPASVDKSFKKMDPATKEKWEKQKAKLEAKREEGKRKDLAERDAALNEVRRNSPPRNRNADADAKAGNSQKKDGKNSRQKSATAGSGQLAREKYSKLIQKDEADTKSRNEKELQRLRKMRQDSEKGRKARHQENPPSKNPARDAVPPQPKENLGK